MTNSLSNNMLRYPDLSGRSEVEIPASEKRRSFHKYRNTKRRSRIDLTAVFRNYLQSTDQLCPQRILTKNFSKIERKCWSDKELEKIVTYSNSFETYDFARYIAKVYLEFYSNRFNPNKIVRDKWTNRQEKAKAMLVLFFQNACEIKQSWFFRSLNHYKKEFDTSANLFLLNILLSIPKNLSYLNLSDCEFVQDIHIDLIGNYFENLEVLNVAGCAFLTDSAIVELAKKEAISNLKELNLAGCTLLTDESLKALSQSDYTNNLHILNLKDCDLITDAAVASGRTRGWMIDDGVACM